MYIRVYLDDDPCDRATIVAIEKIETIGKENSSATQRRKAQRDKNTAEPGKLNAMNAYAPPSLGEFKDFLHTILRVSCKKKRTATRGLRAVFFFPKKIPRCNLAGR